MDPRGATAELSALERLAASAGIEVPNLLAARERTATAMVERRRTLAESPIDEDVAVVVMGSWGRRELTSASDDDWLLLIDGPARAGVHPSPDEVGRVLPRAAGREGIFESVVDRDALTTRIGLARDTNESLTRRMLLLLESVPLVGPAAHHGVITALLETYLGAGVKDCQPPRFLLNDVIRYWRTVAVDFEGKDRDRAGAGWGLRNAKLRTSRKLLFAGGLLPVLECHSLRRTDMVDHLRARLALPPTDRVAQAFLDQGLADAGGRCLAAYDEFIALLDDTATRGRLSALGRADAATDETFARVRRIGRQVEQALLALLFETRAFAPLVRQYVVF